VGLAGGAGGLFRLVRDGFLPPRLFYHNFIFDFAIPFRIFA
jgi:hypothetical protein